MFYLSTTGNRIEKAPPVVTIYCSTTNSAGQLRRMNYLTFEEDNRLFNFPVRFEFVAMIYLLFQKEHPIE
uniref:Uncharacterized protein n=1 Tax=Romanomermis culicivorax TaxID=13658 RepID=A0A915J1E8_ROMCU